VKTQGATKKGQNQRYRFKKKNRAKNKAKSKQQPNKARK
jgi:hypothetical protein